VRVGLGAACLLVPAWVAITRWSTLIAGHPAYPVLLAVLVLLGVLLLVRRARPRRTGRLRLVGRVVVGLLLVAVLGCTAWLRPSYPDRDLTRAPLIAASVSGERDGVISQARLDQSRAQLPAGTEFTEVPGAVHAFFGDYGPQPGDGTPTASRADAQREIVAATERFLAGMAGPT
jgi:hypothetical protein